MILWDQLGEGTPQHHQRSVELFYQLHNLVPSSSTCEDVISQQLMHRDKVSKMNMSDVKKGQMYIVLYFIKLVEIISLLLFCFSENSFGSPREVLCSVAFNARLEHHQVFSV